MSPGGLPSYPDSLALLRLLQLTSPALPVGAYSYSEGIESLVEMGTIADQESLYHWLSQELRLGAVRLEAAVMLRAYQATKSGDAARLEFWNTWLSAARETEELRNQSWQMGRSLLRLLQQIHPHPNPFAALLDTLMTKAGQACNFAVAFGMAAASWEIDLEPATAGYLQSWAMNLISAGIRLIPLGQTSGQQLLLELQPEILQTVEQVLGLEEPDLFSCSWGLAIASMKHEVQYSRLFRS